MMFDAFGRFALGQISPPNIRGATINLTGVSGVGVAHFGTATVLKGLTGVAGIGTIGILRVTAQKALTGVSGGGVAGTLRGSDTKGLVGVAGTGVAHGLSGGPWVQKPLPGVAGVGVAGILFDSVFAFILGVSGGGVAGTVGLNPSGVPAGVAGIGVAGILTVTISGGGGSAASSGDGDRPHRKRPRTGLEPIAKALPAKPQAPKPHPLPPDWMRRSPSIAPAALPIEETYPEIAQAMPGIAHQIMDAHDVSDVMRRLTEQDYDEQDMADIADVLALLD